ncbi:MAG: OadG family protein, partial [Opitutales bacterium]
MQNLLEALEHLTGFLIVFLALTVLWGITVLVGRLCVRLERPRTPKPVGRDQPALPPPPARAHA